MSKEGRDAFYTCAIAKDLVAHLRDLGGLHSLADFAAHAGAYVDPIRTAYKGYDIYECPPNGQGIIALLLLNILAGFELPSMEARSEEHTSELQSLMRISYAVFCLKKKQIDQ